MNVAYAFLESIKTIIGRWAHPVIAADAAARIIP
jgi:hypothetical protein